MYYQTRASRDSLNIMTPMDKVIVDARGPCMCLDASYFKHQIVVMEIRYEQNKDTRLHLEEQDEWSSL